MNDVELKVLLDELHEITDERIIRITNENLVSCRLGYELLCESKGGHEFVSDGICSGKTCKYCGKPGQ